jgi:hypothetical protein
VSNQSYPPPAVAAIGNEVIVPVTVGGREELACWDGSAGRTCTGPWPVELSGNYASGYGAPFPKTSSTGALEGFCLPMPAVPCFSPTGSSLARPAAIEEAIAPTSGWNGPALLRGTRVYLPDGNTDEVECFDYSDAAACPGYPHRLEELGLLYTVNADPERARCVWINSDDGNGQIQDFDELTREGCE